MTTRLILLTLFISVLHLSYSQDRVTDTCSFKPFQAYIDDKDDYSNIRNSPKGEIVLKINNKYSYGYIINIIDCKDGWFKIDHISGIDEYQVSNFEGWVHSSIVGAAVTHSVDLLDEPNGKTKVGKLIGEQDSFKIIDAHCEWIKVDCNGKVGWVKSEKICGNPVTTCP